MPHMQPQITDKQKWLMLETRKQGIVHIPLEDAEFDVSWVKENEELDPNDLDEVTEEQKADLKQAYPDELYDVTGIQIMTGYGARLSAPGYLDATEWAVFDSEEEAKTYLQEMYDVPKKELKFASENEALQYLADLTGKKIKVAASKYGWLITWGNPKIDLDGDKGTCGPSDIDSELSKQLKAGKGDKFELYDDDKELYYKGLIIGDYEGFEPLDEFGTPNAGATDIKIND